MKQFLFYLPVIGIVINMLAVAGYVYIGDYPRAFYWISAALITTSTLLIR